MGSTKSNKIRYVPLLEDVSETLRVRSQKHGYVFSKNNEPLGPMLCLNHLHGACKRAGLRKIGWHVLRHTFASHLAQKGVSIVLIKDLLGHADIKTTMRYSHLTSLAIKEAVETLNQNFGHNMVTIPDLGEKNSVTLMLNKSEVSQKHQ